MWFTSTHSRARKHCINIVIFIDSDTDAKLEKCHFSVTAIIVFAYFTYTIWYEYNKNLNDLYHSYVSGQTLHDGNGGECERVVRTLNKFRSNDTHYVLICLTTPLWCTYIWDRTTIQRKKATHFARIAPFHYRARHAPTLWRISTAQI